MPETSQQGKVRAIATTPTRLDWRNPGDAKRYLVEIVLEKAVTRLKPGMTAAVRINGAKAKNVLRVPPTAIHRDGKQVYCLVQVGDKTEKRVVTIGTSDGKYVEIKSGLRVGDEVVLRK